MKRNNYFIGSALLFIFFIQNINANLINKDLKPFTFQKEMIKTNKNTVFNENDKSYLFNFNRTFSTDNFYKLTHVIVNLPENDLICQNETKILDGTVQNSSDFTNITYEWTDDSGNILGTNAKLTIDQGGTYTVNITADGNTTSFTDIVEQYPFECRVPEAISPNGDGLNDQWYLDYLAKQGGIDKVEIFDRRGVKVYDKENYINEFVGKNNSGNELPAATYYYVIKLKNGQKLTGWLYLSR